MVNALAALHPDLPLRCVHSRRTLLFYIFYELSLIPVFFLLLYWGGERRRAITVRFFIYTLLGGLSLLFGIGLPAGQVAGFNGDFGTLGARSSLPYGHADLVVLGAVPRLRDQAADLPLPQLAARYLHHGTVARHHGARRP
jgi:hypothetical protein